MATTIQISEKTKEKLFSLINQLEKKWKKRVTYDEAIKFLLKNRKIIFNREDFIENMERFEGIFKKGEARELYNELRKKEREREEKLEQKLDSD
ncbi:MAG: hypothetical protein ACOC44_05715 [Promethearchaeia archaeon]